MTMFLRNSSVNFIPEKSVGKKETRIRELILGSRMSVTFSPAPPRSVFELPLMQSIHISVAGECAKFPSISNNRILSVVFPKGEKPRAISSPNLEYTAILEALTRMYSEKMLREMPQPCFLDDKTNRLFMLVLLGDACSRMDSHNTTKAMCDWVQAIGLVKNDKNLDALPLLKRNHGIRGESLYASDIFIWRGVYAAKGIDWFIQKSLHKEGN